MTSTLPTSTPAWFRQNYVTGSVDLSNSPSGTFKLGTYTLPSPLPDTALLVQNLYLACDPVQLITLTGTPAAEETARGLGLPPSSAPVPVWAFAVSRVLKVGGSGGADEKFKAGDLVVGVTSWAHYAVLEKKAANLVQPIPGLSPSVFLGALGMSGPTAYFCLVEKLNLKPTDTLVVSGAAGSVGNVAVQYAKKVLGVGRVVGIAGSDEKCEWLKSIGADAAVNYKSKTFSEDLKNAVPNGVDKFFDNVGGSILDEVLLHANQGAVIALCGRMSSLSSDSSTLNNFGLVIQNSLEIKGFNLVNYMHRLGEGINALVGALLSGKLTVEGAETVVDLSKKFEDIPKVWHGLFEGKNTGKLIIKLAE